MISASFNKYRSAMEVLQRGREQLVEEIADEVLERSEDFAHAPFLFNEFLENQGTKLHFLGMLVSQMELSAEDLEEKRLARQLASKCEADPRQVDPAPAPKSRAKTKTTAAKATRTRASSSSKKLGNQQSASHRKPNADES